MDQLPGREQEFLVDLESDGGLSDNEFTKVCGEYSSFDESGKGGIGIHLKKLGDEEEEEEEKMKKKNKEKRKSMSSANYNKPPRRPPRYPKTALSLDAADQRLIKEISRIAMIKHARDERMKALKKMKAAKASSSSSTGNLFAMITTLLFCLVLIFQGMSSSKRLTINIQSPHPSWAAENHIVSVNDPSNTSSTTSNATPSGSLDSLKRSLTLEPQEDDKRSVG
ncbi:uncharacterized protein LOC124918465 isoform X1 [Impatiens glandulifera]|uniref:uncharacterized protein LOC124918465 isoform X1 n=1 Tax=Impatiens glandulifera TaxID=253017 RepID=UPI001FB0FD63|nr:uncharacterized protein LOC124918465 isoform X1 [Impatiens glandulifera]